MQWVQYLPAKFFNEENHVIFAIISTTGYCENEKCYRSNVWEHATRRPQNSSVPVTRVGFTHLELIYSACVHLKY